MSAAIDDAPIFWRENANTIAFADMFVVCSENVRFSAVTIHDVGSKIRDRPTRTITE
jgi:hypothetical protein